MAQHKLVTMANLFQSSRLISTSSDELRFDLSSVLDIILQTLAPPGPFSIQEIQQKNHRFDQLKSWLFLSSQCALVWIFQANFYGFCQ